MDAISIIVCAFLILVGVATESWLVKNGYVRDKTFYVIFVALCSVFIKQIWFPSLPWWYFLPFAILAMIAGVNRGDLWTTLNKGRWWWKGKT